jgi:hypothetical protein
MLTELTITDITRMAGYFICIAGIDKKGKTIRPLYEHKRIEESWCLVDGKEIRPFTRVLIDLEKPRPNPTPPHMEDWFIGTENQQVIGYCTEEEKKDILKNNLSKDTAEIFGTEIQRIQGEGTFVKSNCGCRSMGTIKAKHVFDFMHDQFEGRWDYRLKFIDESDHEYRLKVVDLTFQFFIDYLRIYKKMPVEKIDEFVNSKIFGHEDIYLRVGLARGWDKFPERCFLQITGLHTFPDYVGKRSFQEYQRDIQSV